MANRKEPAEENSSANSSGSIIQIRSIHIELPLPPVEMNPTQCSEHSFSIRAFTLAKRSNNQKVSSLFASTDDSNDKELPPMETPKHSYWRCLECNSKEIKRTGVQLGMASGISEDMPPVSTESGKQQVLVPETTEGIQIVGTNPGMHQVHVPDNTEDVQSIGTDFRTQKGVSEGTRGTMSVIPHVSVEQNSECVQSIGTNIGKLKGQTAPSTVGMRSIVANVNADKNAVESFALLPNSSEITSAEAGDISHTGEVPAEKLNTNSDDINTQSGLHKSTNRNKRPCPPEKHKVTPVEHAANGIPGKVDETDNGCRENENYNGNPRRKIRKVRLMTDLLGDKGNSTVKIAERNSSTNTRLLESTGSGNAVLEGHVGSEKDVANRVQSPKRKAKVSRESEETNDPSNIASNGKVTKKDTGKAIMAIDITDSDVDTVPSGSEGLFIGTKTEHLRRRSEITPSVNKKKGRPTEVLDISASHLNQSPPASPAAGRWGSPPSAEQRDQNRAGLFSAGLNSQQSFNSSGRVGLDLSLGNFARKTNYLDGGSQAFQKKDDILFGKSNAVPSAELKKSCSKGQSLDLNERAALIPYNPGKNKFPVQTETDFLKLSLKDKSSNHENSKESDQRTDEFPMEIVELLAKQQHDRKNDEDVNPVVQRSSALPSQYYEKTPVTMKNMVRGYPSLHGIPPVEAPHGTSVVSENGRKHIGVPVTFANLSKNHMKLFQTEGNRKSIYTTPAQNQQKPSSGIQISSPGSVRDGLHHTQALEPILSSTSAKHPFGFCIQQKQTAEHHKGKTISDIKLDELKKSEEARSIYKSGDSAIGSKAKGPSDTYNYHNESIPALQLLSLMDGGSSGTSFSLGATKIPDKAFSPCLYPPSISRDERHDVTNGSLFLRQSLTKENPTHGPTFSSYQSLRPHSAASSQLSFLTPEKEMSGNKSQIPGYGGGVGPISHIKDKQKAITNGVNTMMRPQTLPPTNRVHVNSPQPIVETSILPVRSGSGRQYSADGVCRTNRNPADFSTPEPGNMYTICGKDLRSRKRKPYTKRIAGTIVDDGKRQRTKKDRPGDEHSRDISSGGN